METTFDKLVDSLYDLPLYDKQQILKLLEKKLLRNAGKKFLKIIRPVNKNINKEI